MNFADQLKLTFSQLNYTPDEPRLSLIAREGLGSVQAWESATARRLRRAVEVLYLSQPDEYTQEIGSVLAKLRCSAEQIKAACQHCEATEEVALAGELLHELCQATRLLAGARDQTEARQVLGVFMEIFSELDEVENQLAASQEQAA